MDNFTMDIVAEGDENLMSVLKIVFDMNVPGKSIRSYQVKKLVVDAYYGFPDHVKECDALILRWKKGEVQGTDTPINLPFDASLEWTHGFVKEWLKGADYGPDPDHDGSNGRGWCVYVGPWGHIGDDHYAACAIVPAWAMYGK